MMVFLLLFIVGIYCIVIVRMMAKGGSAAAQSVIQILAASKDKHQEIPQKPSKKTLTAK
ncbi:hypothetical protein LF817_05245 [Halobacillus sp. A1]|uniref:hypothetical protein n=1 Tax=Halobacillus sp. A1 TaxID=2880262 RepID=UPI0020A66B1C|nr:hypothetical protein [Halobacillus sp. A1]MCP3030741.1 hypothetical protein [Halobacillus sp. A1]